MSKITKVILDNLRKTHQKSCYGSSAQSMFVNGKFNYSNWNGGDGLIRQFFSQYRENSVQHETKVYELSFTYEGLHFWGDIIVTHTWYEDQNYATIVFAGNTELDGVFHNDKFENVAYFTWYKSRGTTESAKYNGQPMTEEDYLFVLNAVQGTGFKFDLS